MGALTYCLIGLHAAAHLIAAQRGATLRNVSFGNLSSLRGATLRNATQRNATFLLAIYRRRAPLRVAPHCSASPRTATQRNVSFGSLSTPRNTSLRSAPQRTATFLLSAYLRSASQHIAPHLYATFLLAIYPRPAPRRIAAHRYATSRRATQRFFWQFIGATLRNASLRSAMQRNQGDSMKNYVCIMGLDPGLSGAVAFYYPSHPENIACYDMPAVDKRVNGAALYDLIQQHRPDLAIIEAVHSMPGQGVSSSFSFGVSYGIAQGVIAAAKVPVVFVTPGKWKKYFLLSSDKEASRGLAINKWPASDHFRKKKDEGRAEAALIALWGARTQI